ncbi:MAG: hypothetical protein J6104_00060 [Methanomicrobium sp.]|nr:hypothetical protein [Methanomicrobium sp.]
MILGICSPPVASPFPSLPLPLKSGISGMKRKKKKKGSPARKRIALSPSEPMSSIRLRRYRFVSLPP